MDREDGGEPPAEAPGPRGRLDTWDDLVLPEHEREVLSQALAELASRRSAIADARGSTKRLRPGITLLFAGGIGTGKTMAAQLLASELGVDLVELDLLSMSTQDNGKAEKDLDRAVADAKRSNAILLFDRSESLPAPGSGSRQSRRRGPSIEIQSLIERSHTYPGVVIFSSRLPPKPDSPLREGTDFAVEFPFPSSGARKEIWRKLLPGDARVSDGQLENLAATFKLPGAAIRRCCAGASEAASKQGTPVELTHLARALDREYRGRLMSKQTREALRDLSHATSPKPSSAKGPVLVPGHDPVRGPLPVRHQPQSRPIQTRLSRKSVGLAVAGILIAAGAGFAVARAVSGKSQRPLGVETASAGPIGLSFPSNWHQQSPPAAPAFGLTDELAVGPASPQRGVLVIGLANPSNGSLPPPVLAGLSGSPSAAPVSLAGVQFQRYLNVSFSGTNSSGSVYELPTTAGTVLGICVRQGAPSSFTASCEQVLGTLKVTSAAALLPGQSASYASALNRALHQLNLVRSSAGLELARAQSEAAQASSANHLAAAHAAAASALGGLTAGTASAANAALVAALRATARAYSSLAGAAAANRPRAYGSASGSVSRANRQLSAALLRLSSLGYRIG